MKMEFLCGSPVILSLSVIPISLSLSQDVTRFPFPPYYNILLAVVVVATAVLSPLPHCEMLSHPRAILLYNFIRFFPTLTVYSHYFLETTHFTVKFQGETFPEYDYSFFLFQITQHYVPCCL